MEGAGFSHHEQLLSGTLSLVALWTTWVGGGEMVREWDRMACHSLDREIYEYTEIFAVFIVFLLKFCAWAKSVDIHGYISTSINQPLNKSSGWGLLSA